MMKHRISGLYILFGLVIFSSCANRVTPTGGKKDIIPPKMTAAEPANYSVNFKSSKIKIDFNEYIYLKELQKQLIISPLIDPPAVITAKKKSVVIELPAT